jgi:hypothetical protein
VTEKLDFHNLADRHYGVTSAVGNSYTEAAKVCLDRHHVSKTSFVIRDCDKLSNAQLEWTAADGRTQAAWANEIDATEAGAYAIALATVELKRGLVAVSRAETRTGADYYLDVPGSAQDLEAAYRLEVSGTDGNLSVLENRLKKKLEQTRAGASNVPAIATVVGFKEQRILAADLGDA